MRESCATSCSWAGTLLFVSGFTGLFRSLIFWNMFRYVYVSNIGSVKNVESEKKNLPEDEDDCCANRISDDCA